jgi:L-amino acid N-acyltransferase YncA
MHSIRPVRPDDAAAICSIYNHYVRNSTISFEETPVSSEEMVTRIRAIAPWYVCEHDAALLGYAHAAPWRGRSAYRFSVESSVYLAPEHAGKGIGKQLYTALITDLRQRGIHAVMGGIALPNDASIALHEALGFVKVAQFREVGRKFDRWLDVGYWQLLLQEN